MNKRGCLTLIPSLFSALSCFALTPEREPWLGNEYEFRFDASYTFDYYSRVANAKGGSHHSSRDNQILLGLGMMPAETWDVDMEIEFAATTRQSFNWRSAALEIRRQWWDDIGSGDPLSVVTGFNARGVHHLSLKDISCPYAAEGNFEFTFSLGKEWSQEQYWRYRAFAFGAIGQAIRGEPWTRAYTAFQVNWKDFHQGQIFANGYFGFGHKTQVDVSHFDGYASIRHRSIDLGLSYRYLFELWGSLTVEYAYRVYARAYPERVNFFTIWYNLPFSFF